MCPHYMNKLIREEATNVLKEADIMAESSNRKQLTAALLFPGGSVLAHISACFLVHLISIR